MDSIFDILVYIDAFFWGNIAFLMIIGLGVYLTARMGFFQLRALPKLLGTFAGFLKPTNEKIPGVHPLGAFFASVGGMIGVGNIVGIVTALQIGGPGALFWVWVTGFFGSIIKYSEIFLGLKHRIPNAHASYDGGPIQFLRRAFHARWVPVVAGCLLCVYGVEIYQFTVVTECLTSNWHFHRFTVIAVLLCLVLFAGVGGIRRIGKICGWLMPIFVSMFLGMGFWVLIAEAHRLPEIFTSVIQSAFSAHTAKGGFIGASVMVALRQGISRAAYSADIGIGYDSIIQSESNTVDPQKQASLALLGVFLDTVICTMSMLLVLISGLWTASPPLTPSNMILQSLSPYFSYMEFFLPTSLLIVGYTTLIAYFSVGLKCAECLAPRHGKKIYLLYASMAFVFFSFFDQSKALLIMSISGACLLCINLFGIFRLRNEVVFVPDAREPPATTEVV